MVDMHVHRRSVVDRDRKTPEEILEPVDSENCQLVVAFDRETDQHVLLRLEFATGGGIKLKPYRTCGADDQEEIACLEQWASITRYLMGRYTLLVTEARERMLMMHQLIRRPHPFYPGTDLQLVVIDKTYGYAYNHPVHGWEYQRTITVGEWVNFEKFDQDGIFQKGEAIPIEDCSLVVLAGDDSSNETRIAYERDSYALTTSELGEARALHGVAVEHIKGTDYTPPAHGI